MQPPDLCSMEPENYKKYFRTLYWSGNTQLDKKYKNKLCKKEKRKLKIVNNLAVCNAPNLLGNPSHFAVYAAIRRTVLTRWRNLYSLTTECSDDSDNEDQCILTPIAKLPKITGVGLKTVFALIAQSRFTNAKLSESALKALLDVLQGHAPEELNQEPSEIISNLHAMLVEVASGAGPEGHSDLPSTLTALSSSCLIALSVARGEADLILHTIASLIMSHAALSKQCIQIPSNLATLQRSVQSYILGTPSRNLWLNYGVPNQSLVTSFPVDVPTQFVTGPGELIVRSLASDGCYLYIYSSKGLLKIGSGYGSSIRQHMYHYKPDFFSTERHGWLGYCKNKLYVRIGRKKTELYEVNKETLEVRNIVRLEPGLPAPIESKCSVFTDGTQLGLILITSYDSLSIRMFDVNTPSERSEGYTLKPQKELTVHLLRRRTLAIGRAPFEDLMARRPVELDAPVAMQFDDCDDDPLMSIAAGHDFALLNTSSGKVYYTGKANSLGYKATNPQFGRWTLMKETVFNRNDSSNIKKCKVVQIAVGHEGVHAILVLDSGAALFTGIARRGEDGDIIKTRRSPKPTRPKRMLKAEGHHVSYAACNYGSTALVTRQGQLLMFGKDTVHCDAMGLVTALKNERVIQVALGKAHAAALTNIGQVFTFGINNKNQCGREFGYTKEKPINFRQSQPAKEENRVCSANQHTWEFEYCRICALCLECTGFSSACQCADFPNRVPKEKCGCGEGDSGCSSCGACRRCAEELARSSVEAPPASALPRPGNCLLHFSPSHDANKDSFRQTFEGSSVMETERDASLKMTSIAPMRVAIPGGHRVTAVACGLHHTVLLTEHGEVLTFGSNQYGQLGAGDISVHHKIVRVRVPKAAAIAAGSNHTVVMTREGEVFTFGSYQKGSLGRPRLEETSRTDRSPIWYASPGRVPKIGPAHLCKAVWISACGDQSFVQISQAIVKTDTLFSATVTANSNSIVILPNRTEHTFKCITINKNDGSCNAWTGPEQVDFVNSLASLDPLYDVLWCYQPQMRVMKCFNILAFDPHKLQRCSANDADTTSYTSENDCEYPNYGSMRRMEDFKNLDHIEAIFCDDKQIDGVALTNMSILNQELAIPCVPDCAVTRMHAALHLLGCLDSMTFCHDNKACLVECKRDSTSSPVNHGKEDFLTVNRFESHGGGWGYSGASVEAIRFMCDMDILLGGFGLFGGRGDYTAKIKLFDIGPDGGDQEGDGELLSESDDVLFECPPRDKYPVFFDVPVAVTANRWYVAWACINGPSSDCGSSGQAMVISDEVGFHFKTSKKSNNGTDVNAGQIPCLLYNTVSPDTAIPVRTFDLSEPVITLSKNISRNVTVSCFRSIITLLQWSWNTFKAILLDTNGQMTINYQKLSIMKHQKRLVYVIRACLRLTKSYINEVFPQNHRKRNSHEYMLYFEAIADVRNLIQVILADPIPTCSMLPKKSGKIKTQRVCYVQFALEMTNSILKESHDTMAACFHAFFPTPSLKWTHLCSLLYHVSRAEDTSAAHQTRELTSTCAALCFSRSLRDVLHYVVPLTQSSLLLKENRRPDSRILKCEIPTKSATVPRSSHTCKPPPVPPRARDGQNKQPDQTPETKSCHTQWHLLDVLPRLLDIVMTPMKQQMMTRQCGKPHDHGEIKQHEQLAKFCCKLVSRMVAELAIGINDIRDDIETNSTYKPLICPPRFMRVNQARSWNTGNGSPDAICFTVDRPGLLLVGACVYGGIGTYEYELELLHDVRLRATSDENILAHCWVSIEVTHGTFISTDCQQDLVQLKFSRPVPLKEDLRYAIRLCNHGGRTMNGDCGLPSVKGPDGTTFRFASCSLSFNGTSLARGQIPSLIYFGTSKPPTNNPESTDSMLTALRTITIRVASVVMQRSVDLFNTLRNELTAEDLRRNAIVLQQSPAVNTLIPYTLASLEGLDDPESIVELLELIHKLLPHVAAINHLIPNAEDCGSSTTTGHYYTWVESDHPYKQASVSNTRVLFPANVSWIVVEMDPRCATAQSEDSLTVYAAAGAPRQRCHCADDARLLKPPFRKRFVQLSNETLDVEQLAEEMGEESTCLHYNCTYVAVTNKLANVASEWPQRAILIPGNEVIFSLETASDYLIEYNKSNSEENRFGFRCLCVGYEDASFVSQRQGLLALEMELAYSGASCAARLLSPDLEIPTLNRSTIMEVQSASLHEADEDGNCEALMLSRGLELSSPPSIHQVLDAQPLSRCMSTERQFLTDFVAGAESTAGGRLARWLAPAPRVEPAKCELKAPAMLARPHSRLTIPVVLRDQYGDLVTSSALKVEVEVQRLDETKRRRNKANRPPDVPYQITSRENSSVRFQSISMMKVYQNFSFEELRYFSGAWSQVNSASATARPPPERLQIQSAPDGTFSATWTPRTPGEYVFRFTLDEEPAPHELTIEVSESQSEGLSERGVQAGGQVASPAARQRRFDAPCSAGLRVRASPSLQAEELGRVPRGACIAYVEELVNKDGTWLRLSADSVRAYADSGAAVAWCLQYNRQLDRVLLQSTGPEQSGNPGTWPGYVEAQPDAQTWTQDEDVDRDCNSSVDGDRKVTFCVHSDSANDSDGSSSPVIFGLEPCKRGRMMREEMANQSPRRLQRRSNGNGGNDEWWTPERCRSSDNLREVNFPVGASPPPRLIHQNGRLTQTGTQTSPESTHEDIVSTAQFVIGLSHKENTTTPRPPREPDLRSRAFKRPASPPPLPARVAPPPKKRALSPAQAECLRAIFAAVLWHEGIVHDAIACAAFLKFHPTLPKQGASVVTRTLPHNPVPRPQRHSLELSSCGQYTLHVQPSTLESLTRSGIEASTSRLRRITTDAPITEEDSVNPGQNDGSLDRPPSIVNVLPPALRALVGLWDALCEAEQLAPATDKFRKEKSIEKNENTSHQPTTFSGIRKKREWKSSPGAKTPYSVRCELCSANVPPPLAAHMRHAHPGCRAATDRGYDRAGLYRRADPLPANAAAPAAACGQLAQAFHLWYIFCEKCREKALKAVTSLRQPKTKTISEVGFDKIETPQEVNHQTMKENAIFLLDLAPLTNAEPRPISPFQEAPGRSPPTPPGSLWSPAPPFQCLPGLGAAPRFGAPTDKCHSLGRAGHPAASNMCSELVTPLEWRVHRSVSLGQAGRDLAALARPPCLPAADPLPGGGSSLLAQPSAALQRLVSGEEWTEGACTLSAYEPPRLDADALMRRPTLAFVVTRRDLITAKQRMDAAVRINAVRQYAFEAMNWLLRSVTQPTCVHDVMWWFCNALEMFARFAPSSPMDDIKESAATEHRPTIPTASASSLCPGGRSARVSRAAFHAFLGSVSALAPNLPTASPAGLQAVRCWALHYTQHDRAFLHRSQVFSVISRILSHSEDGAYEEGMLRETLHNYMNKENYVWSCPDVSGWCDVTVSSRQGMAGALIDGSTETFWESGDEDRNKAKWIQVAYPGGTPEDRPHLVCLHIDNTRDTVNKTLLVSFLYSGGSNELCHMMDMDVDAKIATWLCFALPRVSPTPMRVRCELRGPEPAVRVRQVRVLAAPTPLTAGSCPALLLHALTEADTLRVFRLLTSQVFGKLLEWERSAGSEASANVNGKSGGDDSDLREHVVGILFAGHQLTSLQRQVMSHIVCAIGCEAARAREDWETALLCAEATDRPEDTVAQASNAHVQDNYCFEMLSLLLALSGSAVGRAHLAHRTELLADLLALLHTGSERVQRQVLSLLRRMIAEIPPQKTLAAINYGGDVNTRVTLLDHLVSYLSKALTVQVKVKGAGAAPSTPLTMGSSVIPANPAVWFMRGHTINKHAHLAAKLLADMAENKVSPAWGAETRTSLTGYAARLATLSDAERAAARCITAPTMWLALAALCVCQQEQLDTINPVGEGRDGRREAEARPFCANHDDGSTLAVIECGSCGALCPECDRFLHLHRAARSHHRQICKEEESAIRIDIHEGCGRAKLFWLLLLVDRRTLKALAEFRAVDNVIEGGSTMEGMGLGGVNGIPGLAGTCRFCGTRGNSGLLAIGNVCADQQCQDHGKEACTRVLSCGHLCGGVRGERSCLPCLVGCAGAGAESTPLKQDGDDMCMICFTDPLQAAPAIQLKCGHVFHLHCCKNVLENNWNGPRITFSFSQCPICKDNMSHWTLEELLAPIRRLREEVRRKALMRLEYEGLSAPSPRGRGLPDPENYAMERYAYYVCHKCGKAYFGGLARCEAETNGCWDPGELVCGGCSDVTGARVCHKHGADFLEYKCRYCCSVAVFFCFGTSHFCNACHDDFQRVTNMPKHLLPHCPAGPKGEQLPGTSEECPLHVEHPETGEEFALGCGVCRHNQTF